MFPLCAQGSCCFIVLDLQNLEFVLIVGLELLQLQLG
jgi:hypothetical protein